MVTKPNKFTQVYKSILYYKQSIHPTIFGHSFGHPQKGSLRSMDISRYYESL